MAGNWADVPYIGPPANYTPGLPDGAPLGVMVHCTANTATPTQEATYAARANPASAHAYAGDANPSLVQSLSLSNSAWHAGGRLGNRRFRALEICGLPSQSRAAWSGDDRDLQAAARFVRLAHEWDAERGWHWPIRWLTRSQFDRLRANPVPANGGLITHSEYNAWAPDSGSDHTDPGPGFPKDLLLRLATAGTAPTEGDGATVTIKEVTDGLQTALPWQSRGVGEAATTASPAWAASVSTRALIEYIFGKVVLGATDVVLDVDEKAIADAVLAGMLANTAPAAIAEAVVGTLAPELARSVVAEIGARLVPSQGA